MGYIEGYEYNKLHNTLEILIMNLLKSFQSTNIISVYIKKMKLLYDECNE